jgi:hypothetical protein
MGKSIVARLSVGRTGKRYSYGGLGQVLINAEITEIDFGAGNFSGFAGMFP